MYQLQTREGRPLGKVLKVNRGDIGSQMLNNNQVSHGGRVSRWACDSAGAAAVVSCATCNIW